MCLITEKLTKEKVKTNFKFEEKVDSSNSRRKIFPDHQNKLTLKLNCLESMLEILFVPLIATGAIVGGAAGGGAGALVAVVIAIVCVLKSRR